MTRAFLIATRLNPFALFSLSLLVFTLFCQAGATAQQMENMLVTNSASVNLGGGSATDEFGPLYSLTGADVAFAETPPTALYPMSGGTALTWQVDSSGRSGAFTSRSYVEFQHTAPLIGSSHGGNQQFRFRTPQNDVLNVMRMSPGGNQIQSQNLIAGSTNYINGGHGRTYLPGSNQHSHFLNLVFWMDGEGEPGTLANPFDPIVETVSPQWPPPLRTDGSGIDDPIDIAGAFLTNFVTPVSNDFGQNESIYFGRGAGSGGDDFDSANAPYAFGYLFALEEGDDHITSFTLPDTLPFATEDLSVFTQGAYYNFDPETTFDFTLIDADGVDGFALVGISEADMVDPFAPPQFTFGMTFNSDDGVADLSVYSLVAVPEPSATAFGMFALIVLSGRRWRRSDKLQSVNRF